MIFMLTALVIAGAGAVAALYLRHRGRADSQRDCVVASPVQRGLFDTSFGGADQADAAAAEAVQRRASLVERARRGDVEALNDVFMLGDSRLYFEALDALVDHAAIRQETLRVLVSRIATNNMRGNNRLAELVIQAWKSDPTGRTTAEALHIAALSDNAKTYQAAVEIAVGYSLSGRLPQIAAKDLISLVESQYWVLSSEARSSGAGFALRQRLAGVCRELTTAPTTQQSSGSEVS